MSARTGGERSSWIPPCWFWLGRSGSKTLGWRTGTVYSLSHLLPWRTLAPRFFPAAFWYPSFYLRAYNGTLLTLHLDWYKCPLTHAVFPHFLPLIHPVLAFPSLRICNGFFTLGKRKHYLGALILSQVCLLQCSMSYWKAHSLCGLISPGPRAVAGRVGAHGTISATRMSLTSSILCSAGNALHCTLGHFIVNAAGYLFHVYGSCLSSSKSGGFGGQIHILLFPPFLRTDTTTRYMFAVVVYLLSPVQLCNPMGCIAHHAPLLMGFSRQEYWSGLPCPLSGKFSWPRDWTCISYVSCIGRQVLCHYHHLGYILSDG